MAITETVLNVVIKAKNLAGGALNRLNQGLDRTRQRGSGAEAAVRKFAASIAALIGTTVGLFTLNQALTAVFRTGSQFEDLRTQINAVMGSIEEGDRATEWIKDFAANTPYQLNEVTDTFVKLKAFGLDPMDGTMAAIVDQASKLGGGLDKLQGVSLALGQAWAKQKLQGEEILQLVERGVPVWELLEKVTGKNTQELQDLSSAGKLGRETIKALIDEIGKSAEGSAAAQMKNLSGIISNLKDSWANFLNDIAQAGALDYLKAELQKLAATIKRMAQDGSLQQWAKEFSDAIIGLGEGVKGFISTLYEWRDAIKVVVASAAGLKVYSILRNVGRDARSAAGRIYDLAAANVDLGRAYTRATTAGQFLARNWKLGLVPAAGAAIYKIGELAKATIGLMDAQERLAKSRKLAAKTEKEFNATLARTSEEIGITLESMDHFNQLQEEGVIVFDKLNNKWALAADLAARQAEETAGAAEAIETLSTAATTLIAKFDELTGKGQSAEGAIGKLMSSVSDTGNYSQIEGLITAIDELAAQGKITDDQIRDGLRATFQKLSTEDLNRLEITARSVFADIGAESQALAGIVDESLRASFKKLGLDIDALRGDITENGQEIIAAFTDIANHADASSKDIASAFYAAVNRAETTAELEALKAEFQKLGNAGKLPAVNIRKALQTVDDKIQESKDGAVTYSHAWQDTADKTEQALQQITGGMRTVAAETQVAVSKVKNGLEEMSAAVEKSRNTLTESRTLTGGGFKTLGIDVDAIAEDEEAVQKALRTVRDEIADIRDKTKYNNAWTQKHVTGPLLAQLKAVQRQLLDASKTNRSTQQFNQALAQARQPTAPATTIKLQAPSGKAVNVTTSGSQEDLLDILAQAGLTTI